MEELKVGQSFEVVEVLNKNEFTSLFEGKCGLLCAGSPYSYDVMIDNHNGFFNVHIPLSKGEFKRKGKATITKLKL